MARGLNKVMIIGNIGSDPEVRYLPNGNPVANFSIATSESWKDKQTGERQDRTEWHRIVMYNRLAEIAGEYLRKGAKVYVEGSLRTRKWQDQSGAEKYMTEIIANEMQMLDAKGPGAAMPQSQGYQPMASQQQSYGGGFEQSSGGFQPQSMQKTQTQQQAYAPSQVAPAPVMDNFDDDIPF